MDRLVGKKILLCQSKSSGSDFVNSFQAAGADIRLASTSKTEFLSVEREALQKTLTGDWLLFSSANGVKAFLQQINLHQINNWSDNVQFAVVGEKSRLALDSACSGVMISLKADNLNSLLKKLSLKNGTNPIKVNHPTSEQSLQNIHPVIPQNINLIRIPFYRTVINDNLTQQEVKALQSPNYDCVIFSSPSSFDNYLLLAGSDRILNSVTVAVFGPTTKKHLVKRGYRVDITPDSPTPVDLLKEVSNFLVCECED